ncbi:MAG: hypothetical protein KIS68_16520 [Bauldia sp.]|nr:hypothetical protein [Bauldia sp.]
MSRRDPGGGSFSVQNLAEAGTPAVYVDVNALFDDGEEPGDLLVGPGLVIRHGASDDRRSFYAFLLTPSGYTIVAWINGSISQRIEGALPDGRAGDAVTLAARQTEDGAEFFLNGQSVAILSDSEIAGTGLGLIVFGSGTFTFDNYGLNSRGEISSAPSP